MADRRVEAEKAARIEEKGPPCRHCRQKTWRVESRPKHRFRFWLETLIAAPEVLLFGDESPGWPSRQAEFWTCLNCGRRVRL